MFIASHRLKQLSLSFFMLSLGLMSLQAQSTRPSYWQQRVHYAMDVALNVENHRVTGTQQLTFTNNSPDTLHKIYYHLYFNAFQPGSMMDVRSRTIIDPDGRVRDRIFHLDESEIGYQKILSLTQNGGSKELNRKVEDTVLEVELAEPIPPGTEAVFDMTFESQVPLQIRRSGRDNAEGIAYSMTQWYPKVAEYDDRGWQIHPYIGREFYPVWGDFDVKITLDGQYTIGATGVLQNPDEIKHGYQGKEGESNTDLTWHFVAKDVHDFAWAADESYVHEEHAIDENRTLHLIYVDGPRTQNWKQLAGFTIQAFDYLDEHIGPYPWEQYTVIQGGDGGMEYPNITLITGHRSLGSVVGVTVHELLHSWFQGLFAFDETHYSWMDEGFTSYYSNRVMAHLFGRGGDIQAGSHRGYQSLAASGLEEPLTTHSDHYETNFAYGRAAYSKGAVFLDQLEYVIGTQAFEAGMKKFYKEWAFKHPQPKDLLRCMEDTSGMELDWYFDQWIGTTNRIDYALDKVEKGGTRKIHLKRKDKGIMPVDLKITYAGGLVEHHHIPLGLMRGAKSSDTKAGVEEYIVQPDWHWTKETYVLEIPENGRVIENIELDPTNRLADHNRLNNRYPFPLETTWMKPVRADYNTYQLSARPAFWYGENAGVIGGIRTYGTAFMNDKQLEFQLMATSGTLDDYDVQNTDLDFKVNYTQNIDGWGKETTLSVEAMRYYGIYDMSVTLKKGLHRFGFLNPKKRYLSFKPFLIARTRDRQTDVLNAGWQNGEIYGLESSYVVGDPSSNGYRLTASLASFSPLENANHVSASSIEFVWNRTREWLPKVESRIGTGIGIGSNNMPTQLRWTIAGPTNYQLWRNETWTGMYNLDNTLLQDAWFIPTSSGLEGYMHPDNELNPDVGGNNYMLLTFWNTWRPNPRSGLGFEWYAAAGRSWNGDFIGDNPFTEGAAVGPDVMISSGVGISFEPQNLAKLRRWVPQSDMLQKMKLSVRMPFFMYDLQGQNDFSPRLLFGISDSF